MEVATTEHRSTVKNLLRYIAGTLDYSCCYTTTTGDAHLISYNDVDMVGDVNGRKSTSGTLFFLGNCPVSWQCQKLRVVLLSSCE